MDRVARQAKKTYADTQRSNQRWWTAHPMTYDSRRAITAEPNSRGWFRAIDQRWIDASFPYLSRRDAFDRIIPPDLDGKRALEIGCGMGLHTSELARRGAEVTAIDLTAPAVEATRARLALSDYDATVFQHDAESLPFADSTFDLVWSWGVIHHSSRTGRIVREISRVLKPTGETRVMVYNRDSLIARLTLLRHYIIGRGYRHKSADEVLWEHTDGFLARYYTKDQAEDLFRTFFDNVEAHVLGQEVDVIPMPSRVRRIAARWLDDERKIELAERRGAFLFITASSPT